MHVLSDDKMVKLNKEERKRPDPEAEKQRFKEELKALMEEAKRKIQEMSPEERAKLREAILKASTEDE